MLAGVVGPQLYADYAVIDGDLTLTLPPLVTAATGHTVTVTTMNVTTWCYRLICIPVTH